MSPEAPKTTGPSLRPLWIVAAVGAVIAADELVSSRAPPEREIQPGAPLRAAAASVETPPCPTHTLPDHGVCIPAPMRETSEAGAAETSLELLPGRPSDYARYTTPVAGHAAAGAAGGSIIRAAAGTEVRAIRLEFQVGATRWATLPGSERLLITLHRVQRAGSSRSYVLVYRGVEFEAPAVWTDVADGSVIAKIGNALQPSGLRLSARQLRRGAQSEPALSERLLRDANSFACDPRNVLPLASG